VTVNLFDACHPSIGESVRANEDVRADQIIQDFTAYLADSIWMMLVTISYSASVIPSILSGAAAQCTSAPRSHVCAGDKGELRNDEKPIKSISAAFEALKL
jgi:hypothetical protein